MQSFLPAIRNRSLGLSPKKMDYTNIEQCLKITEKLSFLQCLLAVKLKTFEFFPICQSSPIDQLSFTKTRPVLHYKQNTKVFLVFKLATLSLSSNVMNIKR